MPGVEKPRVRDVAAQVGVQPELAMTKLKNLGEYVRSADTKLQPPVARKLKAALEADVASAALEPAPEHDPFADVEWDDRVRQVHCFYRYRGEDGSYYALGPRQPSDQVIGHREYTVTTGTIFGTRSDLGEPFVDFLGRSMTRIEETTSAPPVFY